MPVARDRRRRVWPPPPPPDDDVSRYTAPPSTTKVPIPHVPGFVSDHGTGVVPGTVGVWPNRDASAVPSCVKMLDRPSSGPAAPPPVVVSVVGMTVVPVAPEPPESPGTTAP